MDTTTIITTLVVGALLIVGLKIAALRETQAAIRRSGRDVSIATVWMVKRFVAKNFYPTFSALVVERAKMSTDHYFHFHHR
jgi:hypothetical protein